MAARAANSVTGSAHLSVLAGAGNVPHTTHHDAWITSLLAYHHTIDGRMHVPT